LRFGLAIVSAPGRIPVEVFRRTDKDVIVHGEFWKK
jgi:hypothetical protein